MKRIFFLFLACFVLAIPSIIGQQNYYLQGFLSDNGATHEVFADSMVWGADTCDVLMDSCDVPLDSCDVPLDSCEVFGDTCYVPTDSCEVSLDSCFVVEGEEGAPTIERVFVNLQVDELSVLSEMNRLDLLDYANYGMKAEDGGLHAFCYDFGEQFGYHSAE